MISRKEQIERLGNVLAGLTGINDEEKPLTLNARFVVAGVHEYGYAYCHEAKKLMRPFVKYEGVMQVTGSAGKSLNILHQGENCSFRAKVDYMGDWQLVLQDLNPDMRSTQGWQFPYLTIQIGNFGPVAEARFYPRSDGRIEIL